MNSGDHQRGFTATIEAYKVFESLKDELFMLLSARLIVELCETEGVNSDTKRNFQSVVDYISRLPAFENVNIQLLFENFKQRLNLARQVYILYSDHPRIGTSGDGL